MQRLKVSGEVRPIHGSLGVKRLKKVAHFPNNYYHEQFQGPKITDASLMSAAGLDQGCSAVVCFVDKRLL